MIMNDIYNLERLRVLRSELYKQGYIMYYAPDIISGNCISVRLCKDGESVGFNISNDVYNNTNRLKELIIQWALALDDKIKTPTDESNEG